MNELPGPLRGTLVLDRKGKHGPLDAAPVAGHSSEKAAAAGCRSGGTWRGGGTARTGSRPAPDGAGGTGVLTGQDGGGGAQPGLHHAIPVRDQAADRETDRSRWMQ